MIIGVRVYVCARAKYKKRPKEGIGSVDLELQKKKQSEKKTVWKSEDRFWKSVPSPCEPWVLNSGHQACAADNLIC